MTLHKRILTFYSGTLIFALIVIAFWSWFEFEEQRNILIQQGPEAAKSESPVVEALEILLVGGVPALLITIIGGNLLMKRALSPISKLTEALETTEIGNLSDPVPLTGDGDELDRMAVVFNHMKERLDRSFTQTKEFTLHASHELKTPLTILHGTLEQMLRQEVTGEAAREKLVSMIEEVQRLSRIVAQLAFLARADAGQMILNKQAIAFDELVKDLLDETSILAAPRSIEVSLQHCEPCCVNADRMRMRQLLLNLADNAVKYNREGGHVWINLAAQGAQAVFTIGNTGPQLSNEHLGRVFERFFRGDIAHSSEADGSGLGLSIAQSIVHAHGAEISYSNTPEGQTQVSLSWPLAGYDSPKT